MAEAHGTYNSIYQNLIDHAEMRSDAATQITLSPEEVSRLEKLGDETGVQTLRKWEKEM